jgi:excisionase family DNA binding protein
MADNTGNRWLSPAEAARLLGVARSTVTRAIAAGRIKAHRCRDGSLKVDGETLRQQWRQTTHPASPVARRLAWDDTPDDDFPPFEESRARVEYWRAELLALELRQRQESLIDAEVARAEAQRLHAALRDHLEALAERLAPMIAAESNPAMVHHLLAEGCRDALLLFCAAQ